MSHCEECGMIGGGHIWANCKGAKTKNYPWETKLARQVTYTSLVSLVQKETYLIETWEYVGFNDGTLYKRRYKPDSVPSYIYIDTSWQKVNLPPQTK